MVSIEIICIVALGLFVAFVVIPSETSGVGLGLNPSTVPTIAILTATIFAAADGFLRMLAYKPSVSTSLEFSTALMMGGISVLAVVLLAYAGALVCVGIVAPLLMLILGERRWLRILATTLGSMIAAYWLFF